MQRKQIKIGDLEISFIEKNETQSIVILCLHALGHSSKDYENIFQDDRYDNYRLIAIDFPSHGHSSDGTKTLSTAYYAEIVEVFISKMKLKNIILLGNSIEGGVGIRLANNKANNIQLLQLANSPGLDKGGFIGKVFIRFMVKFFEAGVNRNKYFPKWFSYYYHKVLCEKEATERRTAIIRSGYEIAPVLVKGWNSFALPTEDLRNIAADIDCPTLVTYAMKDRKVQYQRNIGGIKRIKNFKLIKYQIGHTPILESSKKFLDDLLDFIHQERKLSPLA